jgi:carbonic anhydrase/acetyltransferase-like protein (isoleucine patch superfamily)
VQSAIVIVSPECREEESNSEADGRPSLAAAPVPGGTPLVCVDVLGQSVTSRVLEELRRRDVEPFLLDSSVDCCSPDEPWLAAAKHLLNWTGRGIESTIVMRLGAYADIDLREFFQFHREQRQTVTRACDREGTLDAWVIDMSVVSEAMDLPALLGNASPAQYFVHGYVNRLQHPRDLRRLVVDSFSNRCRLRPTGTEIRPGVWIEDGAQVHRDARIVAPAFIGRGTRIGEQCLITRSSNVESSCQIDYGTVVEDSSILSNSYVGIGLDISHSIVDGRNLLNLERGVTLEIADPCVIRPNRTSRQEKNVRLPVAFDSGNVHFSQVEEGSR